MEDVLLDRKGKGAKLLEKLREERLRFLLRLLLVKEFLLNSEFS